MVLSKKSLCGHIIFPGCRRGYPKTAKNYTYHATLYLKIYSVSCLVYVESSIFKWKKISPKGCKDNPET